MFVLAQGEGGGEEGAEAVCFSLPCGSCRKVGAFFVYLLFILCVYLLIVFLIIGYLLILLNIFIYLSISYSLRLCVMNFVSLYVPFFICFYVSPSTIAIVMIITIIISLSRGGRKRGSCVGKSARLFCPEGETALWGDRGRGREGVSERTTRGCYVMLW